jgi:hypothetical protein
MYELDNYAQMMNSDQDKDMEVEELEVFEEIHEIETGESQADFNREIDLLGY